MSSSAATTSPTVNRAASVKPNSFKAMRRQISISYQASAPLTPRTAAAAVQSGAISEDVAAAALATGQPLTPRSATAVQRAFADAEEIGSPVASPKAVAPSSSNTAPAKAGEIHLTIDPNVPSSQVGAPSPSAYQNIVSPANSKPITAHVDHDPTDDLIGFLKGDPSIHHHLEMRLLSGLLLVFSVAELALGGSCFQWLTRNSVGAWYSGLMPLIVIYFAMTAKSLNNLAKVGFFSCVSFIVAVAGAVVDFNESRVLRSFSSCAAVSPTDQLSCKCLKGDGTSVSYQLAINGANGNPSCANLTSTFADRLFSSGVLSIIVMALSVVMFVLVMTSFWRRAHPQPSQEQEHRELMEKLRAEADAQQAVADVVHAAAARV